MSPDCPAESRKAERALPILWNHHRGKPIGRWSETQQQAILNWLAWPAVGECNES